MATNEKRPVRTGPNTAHAQRAPGEQPAKKKKRKRKKVTAGRVLGTGLLGILKAIVICGCVGVMLVSVAAVLVSQYVVSATENDAVLLNLDQIKLSYTTRFYAKNPDTGEYEEYAKLYNDQQRTWVDLAQIPVDLQNAFIAVEDATFKSHSGVNYKRTVAAAVNLVMQKATGGKLGLFSSMQGASTIDQQLIKNITGDDDTDPMRKVREVFRAIGLENRYSKDLILEAYLNTISLTGNLAGVEAGAEHYFGKSVSQLNPAECASIAGITRNPTKYNPVTNPVNHLERRNYVLSLMAEQGMLTEAEAKQWQNYPLEISEEKEEEVVTRTSTNSWFTDAALEQILPLIMEREGFETRSEAYTFLTTEGFNVYLTVNPFMQEEMEKLMLNEDTAFQELPKQVEDADGVLQDGESWVLDENGSQVFGPNGKPMKTIITNAAMVTIDNSNPETDGQVLAIVGGLREKKSDRVMNRALTPHQVGSCMKPIGAYALGIEYRATHYSDAWLDEPYQEIEDPKRPGQMKEWPTNYGGKASHENVLVYKALARSLNTVPVWLAGELVGEENIFDFMHNTLNMTSLVSPSENAQFNDQALAPLVLGALTEGVTPLEMVGAYQIFANGGTYYNPTFFTKIERQNGESYMEFDATSVQALSPEAAMVMNRLLRNPVIDPQGTAAGLGSMLNGMEIIAKTGTTQDWKDYYFMGATPYYTTAVWYGYDEPHELAGYASNSQLSKQPQQAFKRYMQAVQANLEYKAFPTADNVVTMQFCPISGMQAGPGCPSPMTGYYTSDNVPNEVCTTVHAG